MYLAMRKSWNITIFLICDCIQNGDLPNPTVRTPEFQNFSPIQEMDNRHPHPTARSLLEESSEKIDFFAIITHLGFVAG
jgi:hypothetical protein